MFPFMLTLLSLLAVSTAAPVTRDVQPYPYPAVNFTSTFPSSVCANSTVNISWTGGSGRYDLFTIVNYPGLLDTHPGFPLRNTTDISYSLTIQPIYEYPTNSTLSIGVEDGNAQGYYDGSDKWSRNSGPLPLVNCD